VLRGQLLLLAVLVRVLDTIAAQQLPVALERRDARGLEEPSDPQRRLLHDLRASLLHRREIDGHIADLDTMHRELMLSAVIQLGRFEQRFRGNAARVQAGAAEGIRAVFVAPLIDARDRKLVLACTNSARIPGGPAADDDHIELGGRHRFSKVR
jgi:hypothetical protein